MMSGGLGRPGSFLLSVHESNGEMIDSRIWETYSREQMIGAIANIKCAGCGECNDTNYTDFKNRAESLGIRWDRVNMDGTVQSDGGPATTFRTSGSYLIGDDPERGDVKEFFGCPITHEILRSFAVRHGYSAFEAVRTDGNRMNQAIDEADLPYVGDLRLWRK